jgi:hypothetical protein
VSVAQAVVDEGELLRATATVAVLRPRRSAMPVWVVVSQPALRALWAASTAAALRFRIGL